jgi:hypothetical protein
VTDPDRLGRVRREFTDKYVVVDAARPELARFGGFVGQVKTVNMNGRALVEFLDFYKNAGWHDIELDYLKVVDKPQPKEVEAAGTKPVAKRAAPPTGPKPAAKRLSPLEMARQQGAAKKTTAKPAAKPAPQGGEKKSVADILAAARVQKKAGDAADQRPESTPDAAPAETSSDGPKASAPAAPKAGKKSIAEILAAARTEKRDPTAGKKADP